MTINAANLERVIGLKIKNSADLNALTSAEKVLLVNSIKQLKTPTISALSYADTYSDTPQIGEIICYLDSSFNITPYYFNNTSYVYGGNILLLPMYANPFVKSTSYLIFDYNKLITGWSPETAFLESTNKFSDVKSFSTGPIYPSKCNVFVVYNDGTLWAMGVGNNTYGQLGIGVTTDATSLSQVAGGGTNWKQVSCGYYPAGAIKTDGTLWTWGQNVIGCLGDGTPSTNRSSPGTTAGGGTTWSQISCGYSYISAIKTDGTLWTWGYNGQGQLGTGNLTDRSSPGTTAGGGTTWSYVNSGYRVTAAIKTDGTLWTWGSNTNGRLGDGTTTARSSPGTTAGGGTTWSQVGCGYYHMGAVKTDGTLWTWGGNAYGQLGDGTTTNRSSPGTTAVGGTTWTQVDGGSNHSVAIKSDGTLWDWGLKLQSAMTLVPTQVTGALNDVKYRQISSIGWSYVALATRYL